MSRRRAGCLAAALALLAPAAMAHPLAPALLELREVGEQRYAVLWRTTVAQARGIAVVPRLPDACAAAAPPERRIEAGEAVALRWIIQCAPPGLEGGTLAVDGLGAAGINAVVTIVPRAGAARSTLLSADAPAYVVPAAQAEAPVFGRYLHLGIEHLATGLDHVLFLLGLFLLVPSLRVLVATVTAFTAGHCATLTLVTLGLMAVPQAPAELAIAATVLLLACALTRPQGETRLWRRATMPVAAAVVFGLIHGAGFAGALREVGLPAGEVPLALLAFNVGIELGQLAIIAIMLALAAAWRRAVATRHGAERLAAAYGIGTCAAYWCFERAWMIVAPVG